MRPNGLRHVGEKLRQIRISEGLTQSQFAQRVQLTQAAVSQIEDGKRFPSSKALQKISVGLNISLDDLLTGIDFECEDEEKSAAIKLLVSKLKNKSISAKEIVALSRYYDARLGIADDKGQKQNSL